MRQEVHDKLNELLTMEANWNSYGGLPRPRRVEKG